MERIHFSCLGLAWAWHGPGGASEASGARSVANNGHIQFASGRNIFSIPFHVGNLKIRFAPASAFRHSASPSPPALVAEAFRSKHQPNTFGHCGRLEMSALWIGVRRSDQA